MSIGLLLAVVVKPPWRVGGVVLYLGTMTLGEWDFGLCCIARVSGRGQSLKIPERPSEHSAVLFGCVFFDVF